ncbi:hypothetical protein [Lactobacillus crispatus]|uniref:hypothetical protein n=1 Tax=Lactobacillus crispatus TaxID=47770 RepID=UPI001E4BCE69|nr:hypothetical protein [Lactobacillus crispatus]
MKKKILTGVIATMVVLTLTGCQNHNQSASVKKTTGVGKVRTSNTSGKKYFGQNGNANNSNVWDSEKQGKLDDFFDD